VDKIDLRKLEWVIENANHLDLGKSYVNGVLIGGDAQLSILKKYQRRAIQYNGEVPVVYYQLDNDGRRFSSDISLTNLSRRIRHTIARNSIDIDIKNAHPCILLWLCKKHGIACNFIEKYVMNREPMIQELMSCLGISRDAAKKMLLRAINRDDGHFQQTENDPEWLYDYHQQCKAVANLLSKEYPEYKKQAEKSKGRKDQSVWNLKGSTINRVLCHHENELLRIIEDGVKQHNGRVLNLAYDGCMIDDSIPICSEELFITIADNVKKVYPGLEFVMTTKVMDEGFYVPDSYRTKKQVKDNKKLDKLAEKKIEQEMKEEEEEEEYQEFKEVFEQTYCKIMEPTGIVCKNSNGSYEFLSPALFVEKFSHRGEKYCEFVRKWWKDTTMRVYTRADAYSPTETCPKDVFNTWVPYPYENVVPVMTPELLKDVRFVLDHLFIICGREKAVYEYMLDWIAQFIQYPQVKTTMPCIAGVEGGGKNTFIELISNMIGKRQVLVTTSAELVLGKFNDQLAKHRLIVLNELSATELRQYDGKIKGLITDSDVDIHGKGDKPYVMRSTHRFIAFSNKTNDPIQTSKEDRRKLIIRASDEKVGDGEYFSRLYQCINNKDVIAFLFTCFQKVNIEHFNRTQGREIPKTEYQQILVQNYSNVMEDWITYIKEEYHINQGLEWVEWTANEQLTCYREFCGRAGVRLELTSQSLSVRLSLYIKDKNIAGITTHKTNICNKRVFSLALL
jgi:hypothetical protein